MSEFSSSGALADAACDQWRPSFDGTIIKYKVINGHIQFNVRGCADGRSQGELNLLKNHFFAIFFTGSVSKRNRTETCIAV